jgi:hypothetical protein
MIRIFLGILLILAASLLLLSFIEGSPLANNLLTLLVCKPGEQFAQELGGNVGDAFGRNRGQELHYYCTNASGVQRDVTEGVIFAGIGGFILPLLLGLLFLLWGIFGIARGRSRRADEVVGVPTASTFTGFGQPSVTASTYEFNFDQPGKSATVITMNGQQVSQSDLPHDTAQLVNQVLDNMGAMMNNVNPKVWTMTTGGDLTDKLRQLQDAKDQGLISQDEYDRLRKEILDNLG